MAIDLQAASKFEDVDNAAAFVDSINDAIGAALCSVTTGEWPEQWLAYAPLFTRAGIAELA